MQNVQKLKNLTWILLACGLTLSKWQDGLRYVFRCYLRAKLDLLPILANSEWFDLSFCIDYSFTGIWSCRMLESYVSTWRRKAYAWQIDARPKVATSKYSVELSDSVLLPFLINLVFSALTGTVKLVGAKRQPQFLRLAWQSGLRSKATDNLQWTIGNTCYDHRLPGPYEIYESCMDTQHSAPNPDCVGNSANTSLRRNFVASETTGPLIWINPDRSTSQAWLLADDSWLHLLFHALFVTIGGLCSNFWI